MTKAIRACTTHEELVDLYVEWCDKHGYSSRSADEIHYELLAIEPRRHKHIKWLEAYIERWEEVVKPKAEPKKSSIEIQDHWEKELSKLRCWLSGFKVGRNSDFPNSIPGEDVLRQIQLAIKEAD